MLYKVSSDVISFCMFFPRSSATSVIGGIRFYIFWRHPKGGFSGFSSLTWHNVLSF